MLKCFHVEMFPQQNAFARKTVVTGCNSSSMRFLELPNRLHVEFLWPHFFCTGYNHSLAPPLSETTMTLAYFYGTIADYNLTLSFIFDVFPPLCC